MLKKTIEQIFKNEILENNIQNVIITSIIAIIAIPFFTILDYFMYPRYLSVLFFLRLIMTIPLVLIFFTSNEHGPHVI